ncbi:hypothetical protein ABW19_dt0205586 [Dactylella cylindrospora]|nr:hypothetical protein ABW19_dt0205586 [Dactylella cylindrospora]
MILFKYILLAYAILLISLFKSTASSQIVLSPITQTYDADMARLKRIFQCEGSTGESAVDCVCEAIAAEVQPGDNLCKWSLLYCMFGDVCGEFWDSTYAPFEKDKTLTEVKLIGIDQTALEPARTSLPVVKREVHIQEKAIRDQVEYDTLAKRGTAPTWTSLAVSPNPIVKDEEATTPPPEILSTGSVTKGELSDTGESSSPPRDTREHKPMRSEPIKTKTMEFQSTTTGQASTETEHPAPESTKVTRYNVGDEETSTTVDDAPMESSGTRANLRRRSVTTAINALLITILSLIVLFTISFFAFRFLLAHRYRRMFVMGTKVKEHVLARRGGDSDGEGEVIDIKGSRGDVGMFSVKKYD